MDSLIHFFKTDAGFATIFSILSTLAAAIISHLIRDRVKLIWFSPQSAVFNIKPADAALPSIYVDAGRVVIQNQGKRSAKCVQVTSMPGSAPAGYALIPPVVHKIAIGERGEWILEIPFLAPSEVITLEILNGPKIGSVRSEDGVGKLVPVVHQRQYSQVVQIVGASLILFGFISIFFLVGWIVSLQFSK